MYSDDTYEHRRNDPEFRRKYKRWLRFRQFIAWLIVLLFVALIIGVIWLLVSKLVKNHKLNIFTSAKYNYESEQLKISVVDNIFTETERRVLFPEEFSDEDEQSEDLNEAEITPIPYIQRTGSGLIIVDAGHGGKDSGTFNDFSYEKDINLDIAYWLKEELELRGYTVFMTRRDDTFVGLQQRANLANDQDNPLAMVSIHQNAVEDYEEAKGVEAWTYDRKGCRELAECLAKCVSEATDSPNRGVNYRTNLVVTSKTTMPSVIIECGYMTNPVDAANLIEKDYQVKLARGIANALDEFIDQYYQ